MAKRKLTRERLDALRVESKALLAGQERQVLVCAGTGCIAGGSLKVYDYLKSECEKRGIPVAVSLKEEAHGDGFHLKKSGCHGFCEIGPLVAIEPGDITYTHVHVEDCDEIIEKTILGGEVIERLLYEKDGQRYVHRDDIPFYKHQQRLVMKNSGKSDAEDLL